MGAGEPTTEAELVAEYEAARQREVDAQVALRKATGVHREAIGAVETAARTLAMFRARARKEAARAAGEAPTAPIAGAEG